MRPVRTVRAVRAVRAVLCVDRPGKRDDPRREHGRPRLPKIPLHPLRTMRTMAVAVHAVPYGAPALERLDVLVREAQASDRLAPVTVVVPTNYVGVATRRALASRGGIAAVTFLTVYRLAELLG